MNDHIFISLPGEYTDLNTYISKERSGYAGASCKKAETWRAAASVRAAFNQPSRIMPSFYPLHFVYTWYTKTGKKDPDNIDFAKKFILDGMVNAGFLRNDSLKEIASSHHIYRTDKENPHVEMRIFQTLTDAAKYLMAVDEDHSEAAV